MPWKVCDAMSIRREFITLARVSGANIRQLCRQFSISPKTGYKWLKRYEESGEEGLRDRSRKPHKSPRQTQAKHEATVVEMRDKRRVWGGRKIRARMIAQGHQDVPAASTITDILRRHGRLNEEEAAKHKAWTHFERKTPNEMWQMDFKGHFATAGGRCHPLTVLDDHSRFSLGLIACSNENTETVQSGLTSLFRRYGLPDRILADNGSPWGSKGEVRYTRLNVWLLRLGVITSHGRAYHPQTQGKEERFHRTLKAELLRWEDFRDLAHCQSLFDAWRDAYNMERPHESLGMQVPASRYMVSQRTFPEALPPIEYDQGDIVRMVSPKGTISYKGAIHKISLAFQGYPVALKARNVDGELDVVFCRYTIGKIDLNKSARVR